MYKLTMCDVNRLVENQTVEFETMEEMINYKNSISDELNGQWISLKEFALYIDMTPKKEVTTLSQTSLEVISDLLEKKVRSTQAMVQRLPKNPTTHRLLNQYQNALIEINTLRGEKQ